MRSATEIDKYNTLLQKLAMGLYGEFCDEMIDGWKCVRTKAAGSVKWFNTKQLAEIEGVEGLKRAAVIVE